MNKNLDNYLYEIAEEVSEYIIDMSTNNTTTEDFVMSCAYNAGDNLSSTIYDNIYSILNSKNIKIQ